MNNKCLSTSIAHYHVLIIKTYKLNPTSLYYIKAGTLIIIIIISSSSRLF
jgi:hypothetical protein